MCTSGWYDESQTAASGSPTSLVLPRQSEAQTKRRRGGGERDRGRMRTPGTSTTRLVVGLISAMVEKELGEKELWL